MRTTLDIDESVIRAAERVAEATGQSVESVMSDALRRMLSIEEAALDEDRKLGEAGLRLLVETMPPEDFSDWERAGV